jgi:hypothetical protein
MMDLFGGGGISTPATGDANNMMGGTNTQSNDLLGDIFGGGATT